MDTDLLMVMGIIVCAIAILSLMAARVDGRISRLGQAMLLIGGVLVVVAIVHRPGGYTIAALPDLFFNVISRYVK